MALYNVEDYFFAQLIALPWRPNDCLLAALNCLFRFPIFTSRWQAHTLAKRVSKLSHKKCIEKKMGAGYTLAMFNKVFLDGRYQYCLEPMSKYPDPERPQSKLLRQQAQWELLQLYVTAQLIESHTVNEILLHGRFNVEGEEVGHYTVFLRVEIAPKKVPVLLHLDINKERPECSHARLFRDLHGDPVDEIDWG